MESRAPAACPRCAPASGARIRPSRASAEQPVDEPGWDPATAIVDQAFAVDPVAPPLRIFDPIIIAQPRRRGLPPPFRGNALGSFGPRDVVHGAAPNEPPRHALRGCIDDVDRLRTVEQALGPGRARKLDR